MSEPRQRVPVHHFRHKFLPLLAIIAALCLGAMTTVMARADDTVAPTINDWRTCLTPTRPGHFPMIRPLKAYYRFGWSGITAARGTLEFARPRPGITKAEVEAHTIGAARALWRMDARAIAWGEIAGFRPVRVRQAEWYRGGTSLAAQEFNPQEVLRGKGATPGDPSPDFFTNAPADAERLRELTHVRAKPIKIPGLLDLQTAVLFVRSQPLAQGDVIRLALVQGNAPYLATLRVLGREQITVAGGTFSAIKVDLTLQDITNKLTLASQKRFKHAYGWFSDDGDRLLVKLETAIFIGSVWAELERVE